jgi:UDP-N-acetylmuramyl pentapeptide phosphotransferase/UDP-N-acetylglucosamine-1-phosphate transferase
MSSLLVAFFSSFIATLFIIRFKHLHQHFSADADFSGPQKFHTHAVPRIGGISIAVGLLIATLFRLKSPSPPSLEIMLLVCAIPTFAIGLTEDLTKKVSVRLRLLFTAIAAALLVYLVPLQITRLDIPYIDLLLTIPIVSAVLTIFAITGLANAYNIIDGFNGLASMVGVITLIAIAYLGFILADPLLTHLSLIMAAAILGFFIWNYPRGLIFLGDGGAYLIGFWIASISILLTYRHQEVSPWFALLVNGYPIMETLFTIYRRIIHQEKSPGQPDGIHFHTLVYRRILMNNHQDKNVFSANARTAPYFWILTGLSMVPAVLWWQSTPVLMGACLLFTASYVWLYASIVKFKTPRWLHLEK